MFLEWLDIDEYERVLRVQGKNEYGFRVKDSEQREIPIPNDLLEQLRHRKAKHKKQRLVLASRSGEPNQKLLRALKRLANRAQLNCNRCGGAPAR